MTNAEFARFIAAGGYSQQRYTDGGWLAAQRKGERLERARVTGKTIRFRPTPSNRWSA